jgi:hypothetical protein
MVSRLAASLAVIATVLSACVVPSDQGSIVELTSSEGTSAALRVVDHSGFLVSVADTSRMGAVDDFTVESVDDVANAIRVSWIASPCEDQPRLTIRGQSLEALEVVVENGPLREDQECPDIGAVLGVTLAFSGDISADGIRGRLVDE